MRTLIALSALTLSLLGAGQAQSVRSAPVRLSLVGVAPVNTAQLPIRTTLPVRGQATAISLSPVSTEPLNTVVNPHVGGPTTAGKWCRWFTIGVEALPVGGWTITNTTGIFNGVPSVLHCRAAAYSSAQAAAMIVPPMEELFQEP